MRELMYSAAAAAMSLAVAIAPAVAGAPVNPHPRVVPGDCQALVAKAGPNKVWQAYFSAQRPDMFDRTEYISVAPCFATKANCVNWLYWAQSDWRDNNVGWCKTGLPY